MVKQRKRMKRVSERATWAVAEAADILETFDLIGGVSSFARWAEESPGEFYRMWAKLAPPPDAMDPGSQVKVIHVVPRSPLDE